MEIGTAFSWAVFVLITGTSFGVVMVIWLMLLRYLGNKRWI